MTPDQAWERAYRAKTHLTVWPWSELVGLYMRYVHPGRGESIRVLELGCGPGANIPFFLAQGASYFAVEWSPTAVESIIQRFPALKGRVVTGDFTKEIPFDTQFDLIVDRSSLTCNPTHSIQYSLARIRERLTARGHFLGVDWFSTEHSEYAKGPTSVDAHTRTGYVNGQFEGLGTVHFSDEPHLRELFQGFELIVLQHKIVEQRFPSDQTLMATWNFVAKKL